MNQEKELEISADKIYNLPLFRIVKYKEHYIAIAVELAKWIVLKNQDQLEIFNMLQNGCTIEKVFEKYENSQDDIISVLTQIEAKQIEKSQVKSIFSNTKLHLHITNQCNMRCPHCYMNSGVAYDKELSTDEIKTLCYNFYSMGGTDVFLTGGEPTVRTDFFEIVEYIFSLGMKISIFSNGIFWNEERVKHIASKNIDGVQISIDGYNEESNSKVRGKNSFIRALKAVDLFVKYNIYVKIAVTAPYELIRNHQEDYIKFSKQLLDKYGNDAIEINYSYFFMPGRELSADKIKEIKNEYYSLVDEVVTGIYGDMSEDSFVFNIMDGVYDSCGYGGLNVMANGDFYFCDRITDVSKIGNICCIPFDEIWKLMKLAEQAGKIDNFKPCKNCELKYICGGGCRAEYFKQFTKINDVKNINFDLIKARTCSIEYKESFYKLMLKTNERFFM